MVYDETKNYDNSFHVGGAMMLAGGLLLCLLHVPQIRRFATNVDLMHTDTDSTADLPVPDEKDPRGVKFHLEVDYHDQEMTMTMKDNPPAV